MAVFKCKMCGGALDITDAQSIVTCDYCKTVQTLPKLNSEKLMRMYDRANHFRRNHDFDKAADIYNQILDENSNDAESYWSLLLCKYGIDYVEDPATLKIIPTINRTQLTSIYDDENYKQAINFSDSSQKIVYENEANLINNIQKEILSLYQNEDPYDIFICYKELDENGKRTRDSVIANDLYYQLSEAGFKVFFSRITLEDKLGTEYEASIFAALKSAKVMVVLGSKVEYFNSVWVKNEWSRFQSMIKQGEKKYLIPAYKDIDPYDLPDEFSHLQAQDMSKIGFLQDLIRGIKKYINVSNETKHNSSNNNADINNSDLSPVINRIFIYIEDGNIEKASEFCDKVLLEDPNESMAYLGRLLIEKDCSCKEELLLCDEPIDDSYNYNKILSLNNQKLKNEIISYNSSIVNRIKEEKEKLKKQQAEEAEIKRKKDIYIKAKDIINSNSETNYEKAINLLSSIPDWEDSNELCDELSKKLFVYNKYNEYIKKYPNIVNKNKTIAIKKELVSMLQNTKFGKANFPYYNLIFLLFFILSAFNILTCLLSFQSPDSSVILSFFAFGILYLSIYFLAIVVKRYGLASAILDYEKKINDISEIPNIYVFDPELLNYKDICDNYIRDKGNSVSSNQMNDWNKQKNTILDQRINERKRQIEAAEEEYKRTMDELTNKEILLREESIDKVNDLNQEKLMLSSKLAKLNIFQGAEKKQTKEKILKIDSAISSEPTKLEYRISQVQAEKNAAKQVFDNSKSKIDRLVENKYPIPLSPSDKVKNDICKIAKSEAKTKESVETKLFKDSNRHLVIKNAIKKYLNFN